jgi:hypothetical protein
MAEEDGPVLAFHLKSQDQHRIGTCSVELRVLNRVHLVPGFGAAAEAPIGIAAATTHIKISETTRRTMFAYVERL